MSLILFAFSLGLIGLIIFWPRKPIEYEEREFLNGTVMVPKDDD